jgi:hypothetical protein
LNILTILLTYVNIEIVRLGVVSSENFGIETNPFTSRESDVIVRVYVHHQ